MKWLIGGQVFVCNEMGALLQIKVALSLLVSGSSFCVQWDVFVFNEMGALLQIKVAPSLLVSGSSFCVQWDVFVCNEMGALLQIKVAPSLLVSGSSSSPRTSPPYTLGWFRAWKLRIPGSPGVRTEHEAWLHSTSTVPKPSQPTHHVSAGSRKGIKYYCV